ncbi:Ammonium transporter [Citrus sinensis]|nr:Ammonium transporter [Citrus sinensis]
MGMLSGSIPWYTMMVLHKKIPMLKRVDDTMAVFHTHAVAGSLGGILAGFFANPKLNRIFYLVDDWEHYIGLAYGFQSGRASTRFRQMGVQLLGISFEAYALWGDGEKYESRINSAYGAEDFPPAVSKGELEMA